MPEGQGSSSSSSDEKTIAGCGHSHYQGGYSWNAPSMNKWGQSGCNGCPLNFGGCAQAAQYNYHHHQQPVRQAHVIRRRNYTVGNARGNAAFHH